jgi:hypothetical protein
VYLVFSDDVLSLKTISESCALVVYVCNLATREAEIGRIMVLRPALLDKFHKTQSQ